MFVSVVIWYVLEQKKGSLLGTKFYLFLGFYFEQSDSVLTIIYRIKSGLLSRV